MTDVQGPTATIGDLYVRYCHLVSYDVRLSQAELYMRLHELGVDLTDVDDETLQHLRKAA